MADRITPWQKKKIDERIDEIVATDVFVHVEMLSENSAFMSVGRDDFAIYVEKGKLIIAHREHYSDEDLAEASNG